MSGLPLAVEFGKHYPTVGFDIKEDRVAELEAARLHARDDERGAAGRQAPQVLDRPESAARTATRSSSPCRRRSERTTAPCSRR